MTTWGPTAGVSPRPYGGQIGRGTHLSAVHQPPSDLAARRPLGG